MPTKVTFILGGAASGKSAYAEEICLNSGKDRVYLATSQVFDEEMRAKVDRHLHQRGAGWTTHEAPRDLAPVLDSLRADQICLLDCATMWLSNQMLAEADLIAEQTALMAALQRCAAEVVVVSNEVGHGIVPDNALARQFREAQGRLNIALAGVADRAVLVTAGLPQVLKGTL
ncbi:MULTISPECIES: bifunctional adenosylcobinamide kinase/adenosylcobinamide-phosphate guanylyltransferase [unclassified Phaeobacter]|uniref:bifunctional adenosylcobinamide kinase/adenosylcobinamide-phosphate guanylyltransferase n=1 Tax=unclassified Phaeobacter TaxID=2621772 RepID=UPI003A87702A